MTENIKAIPDAEDGFCRFHRQSELSRQVQHVSDVDGKKLHSGQLRRQNLARFWRRGVKSGNAALKGLIVAQVDGKAISGSLLATTILRNESVVQENVKGQVGDKRREYCQYPDEPRRQMLPRWSGFGQNQPQDTKKSQQLVKTFVVNVSQICGQNQSNAQRHEKIEKSCDVEDDFFQCDFHAGDMIQIVDGSQVSHRERNLQYGGNDLNEREND